ncbi:hypothetical protein Q7A53_05605 [Halobacillus rhizosphaerae]|uniref:hypothetical protein n=1 Tax=Halobacillus rhizosphaerae TaxID=3064889 RepID=UPI00398AB8F5
MKSNYECANFDCGYSTDRIDNLKIKDLNKVVKRDGGSVENGYTCCPKCRGNTLVYVSDLKGDDLNE